MIVKEIYFKWDPTYLYKVKIKTVSVLNSDNKGGKDRKESAIEHDVYEILLKVIKLNVQI